MPHFAKKSVFWRADFQYPNQINGKCTNMKFSYNIGAFNVGTGYLHGSVQTFAVILIQVCMIITKLCVGTSGHVIVIPRSGKCNPKITILNLLIDDFGIL